MKLKFLSLTVLAAITLLFTSCQDDNIDELITNDNELGTVVIDCELEATIEIISIEENGIRILTATCEGGIAPYIFNWLHLENEIITVENTSTIEVNKPHEFAVIVSDAEGCFKRTWVSVPLYYGAECAGFEAGIETNENGLEVYTWETGTPPYSFSLQNGEVIVGSAWSTPLPTIISGLNTITVTDALGCEAVVSAVSCTNGATLEETTPGVLTATAYAWGGAYSFQWSTGETSFGISSTISVSPGTYSVEMSNSFDCQEILSITVE